MVIKNYKKLISIILTICVVSFFAITAAIICFNIQNNQNKNPNTFAAGGSGTAANPYLIESADELYKFLNFGWKNYAKPDGYFKLTTDVDFSEYVDEWEDPIYEFGKNFTYSYEDNSQIFKGTFDGDGHTIKSLRANSMTIPQGTYPSLTCYYGLFARLGGDALIKNIRINLFGESIDDLWTKEHGNYGKTLGVIAGMAFDGGTPTISNCELSEIYIYTDFDGANDPKRDYGIGFCVGVNARTDEGYGNESYKTTEVEINDCYFSNVNFFITCKENNSYDKFKNTFVNTISVYYTGGNCVVNNCVAKSSMNACWYEWSSDYTEININWGKRSSGCVTGKISSASDLKGCSEEGGKDNSDPWYWNPAWGVEESYDLNDDLGVPYLRTFVNWKEIEFKMFIEDAGHVDLDKIYIPNDVELQQTYGGVNQITILGQIISVNLEPGNKIHSWRLEGGSTYVVYTLTAPIILRFYQASVQEPNPGDIIATPDGGYSKPDPYENGVNVSTTTYYIEATTVVQASTTSGYLIYNFTDKDGVAREIQYNISGFTVIRNNANSLISGNIKIIKPLLKIRTGSSSYITFMGNANTTNKTTSTVNVSESPKLLSAKFTNRRGISGSKITFTCGSEEFVYEANYNYTIISFTVDTLSNSTTYTKDLSQKMLECTITVQVAELLKVQYHNPDAINGKTPAEKSGDDIMQVIEGEEVKVSIRDNALIYSYSNGTYSYSTKYTPNKYYVLDEENSVVSDFMVDDWMSIKPVYFRSVVPIKLKLQGEGSITVVENANDIVVTQSGNEINFEVEFGTELIVTPDANYNKNENEYIYTFVYDNETLVVIKVTKLNNMYYLEDNGINNYESITFDDDEAENITIIPIIQQKVYNIEIK